MSPSPEIPKASGSGTELRRRKDKKTRSSPRSSPVSTAELSPATETGQLFTESTKGRQSMLSIPTDDNEDYIFWRLSRKLKGQWHKLSQQLVEKYPQGIFQRRAVPAAPQSTETSGTHAVSGGVTATDAQSLTPALSNASCDSVGSMSHAARTALSKQDLENAQNFAKDLLESLFALPQLSQRRDEEDRKGVPLISSLLRVSVGREVEGGETHELFNPNPLFLISCEYGIPGLPHPILRWAVHRKLIDIFKLHTLLIFRELQGLLHSAPKLPAFPNQFSYLLDVSLLATLRKEVRAEQKPKLMEDRRRAIEKYINNLLRALNMQIVPELCEFLEFSGLSLQATSDPQGRKLKEGYLKNRIFEVQKRRGWCSCLFSWASAIRHYQTKWFILRPSYIMFLDHLDQPHPSDVLLVDQHFRVEIENLNSKNPLKPFSVSIRNGSKRLEVRPEHNAQMQYWIAQLSELSLECPWSRTHRFGSFAPIRSGAAIDWLIDAEEYFTKLIECIKAAKTEIYIHGWWVSPEMYLKRPAKRYPQYRLDVLLKQKAKEGVRIYVIIFKELSLALAINSYHTKTSLEKLHPNIRVQRHPDHLSGGVLYWSRHEKLVVIDQKVAFIGGLDLAYGRFDTHSHKLSDEIASVRGEYEQEKVVWTGIDYSNPRIRDFRNVAQHTVTLIDRSSVPRMPWHDVHSVVYGQPARDLARHFIQSWNFVKAQKAMHRNEQVPFLLPMSDELGKDGTDLGTELGSGPGAGSGAGADSGTCQVQVLRSCGDWSLGCPVESSIYSAYLSLIEQAEHFIYIENQFLITCSDPDNESSALGSGVVKNRIGAALTQKIIRAHREGRKFRVVIVMPLLPAFEAEAVDRPEASAVRLIMQNQYASISKGPSSIMGQLLRHGIDRPEEYISFFSLRKHEQLTNGSQVTEQVYVHTKLAVFDDRWAILGSANINDRSMLGVRDSELAIVVQDTAINPITLDNGIVLEAGVSVQQLRVRLWQEHLGLSADESAEFPFLNPLDDGFYYGLMRTQASRNTQIFRELFHCVPDDYVESWAEYAMFVEKPLVTSIIDPQAWKGIDVMDNLKLVKGNLVLFPTNFLKKEELSATMLSGAFLLPIEIYS